MLYAYADEQTVANNGTVLFDNIGFKTGNSLSFTAGEGTIRINRPGYYRVDFHADSANTTSTGAVIKYQLMRNDVEVAGASGAFYSSATTDEGNVAFTAIVKVMPGCPLIPSSVVLSVENTGGAASVVNASITVQKIA